MSRRRRSNLARLFAPLALLAVLVAVFVIVQANRSSNEEESAGTGTTTTEQSGGSRTTAADDAGKTTSTTKRRARRVYVVKTGDILSTVAEKTGLTVAELQELNPDLDPQALQVGQRLKLRPEADPTNEDGADTTTTP